jgi:hypothetical protein
MKDNPLHRNIHAMKDNPHIWLTLDRSKRKKTLIQSKNTTANNNNVQGADERYNTEVDGRMHNE